MKPSNSLNVRIGQRLEARASGWGLVALVVIVGLLVVSAAVLHWT